MKPPALLAVLAALAALSLSPASAGDESASPASPEKTLALVEKDLLSLPKADRPYARYLTLAHLASAGRSPEELAPYFAALSKLANGLSWKKDVKPLRAVDPGKTLIALDLRDYGWDDGKTWDLVLAAYPYSASRPSKACSDETGCEQPLVRGDWFLAAGSRAPLYDAILRLPANVADLEKALGIAEVDSASASAGRARAGFHASGESDHNRVIERRDSPQGAFWRTYDFRDDDHERNVFARPLGPGKGEFDFSHDQSELMFHLPNGLFAFMIADAAGARADEAAVALTWNKEARAGSIRIKNGLSCMTCHAAGPRTDHPDQMRRWYVWHDELGAALFPKRLVKATSELYVDRPEWDELLAKDATRHREACAKALAPLSQGDALPALVAGYEDALSRRLAAAELGLDEEAFAKKLAASPVAAIVPLGSKDGKTARADFQAAFPEVVEKWQLGKAARPARALPLLDAPPAPGRARLETPLGEGLASIEVDSSWQVARRRRGLTLGNADLSIVVELRAHETRLAGLDALLQEETRALGKRLHASRTLDLAGIGKVLELDRDGEAAEQRALEAIALEGSSLLRLTARFEAADLERAKKTLDALLATLRFSLPGKSAAAHLPARLEAAGFETDYASALARARAEKKLVMVFVKPAVWWYT